MPSPLLLVGLLACRPVPDAPDLVLVTVDTLRADRLGFMGDEAAHTPHLDALAAGGRVFTQATTPLPRTTPALASVLTGRWPHHHGSREVGDPIGDVTTLAEVLRRHGYRTVAASAMHVAGPEQGLDAGFDAFELAHDARAPDLVTRALGLVVGTRPHFLWVHFADPHFPYVPREPAAPSPCRALGERVAAGTEDRVALMANVDGLAQASLADCAVQYAGEITAVDAAVGALLFGLRDRPRAPVVALSADHGEHLGEAGLFYEHGPHVHDAALRVPLVVAGPGVEPGTDDGVARLEDLAPTLLALAGVPEVMWPELDGVDLGPRLVGARGGPDVAVAESGSALQLRLSTSLVSGRSGRWCLNAPRWSWCRLRKGEGLFDRDADPGLARDVAAAHPDVARTLREAAERWAPEQARERTARTERFKLVGRPALRGGYSWALYDLADDPGEERDVSAAHPDEVAALRQALSAWPGLAERAGGERSDELLEALRTLGYVDR